MTAVKTPRQTVQTWLCDYLTARGGVADHFEVLQAAWDVNPAWTSAQLRPAIRRLGGRNGAQRFGGRWVFDLNTPAGVPVRPERPAGGWYK
jgi:hypothetical protein